MPRRPSRGPFGSRCLTAPKPCGRPRRRLRGERVEVLRRVEPARVGGEGGPHPAAEQVVNGNAELLPEQVPEGDVDGADRVHDDTAAPDVERGAVHRLPGEGDLRRRSAGDDRLELLQQLHRGRVPEAGCADPDQAVGVLELDHDEPRAAGREPGGGRAPRVVEALERGQRRPDGTTDTLRRRARAGRHGRDSHVCDGRRHRGARLAGPAPPGSPPVIARESMARWSDKSRRGSPRAERGIRRLAIA